MITLKSIEEMKLIDDACTIVMEILMQVSNMCYPGINVIDIEKFISDEIDAKRAISGKGYRDYPSVVCISVNNEVVHGIPCSRVLEDGDLITIDLFLKKNGWWGDSAVTFLVCDNIEEECQEDHSVQQNLIDAAVNAFYSAFNTMKNSCTVEDISNSIESTIVQSGFSTNSRLTGHGIGQALHEQPQVPCKPPVAINYKIVEGMVLAIEPIVHENSFDIQVADDGWTVSSVDGGLSAHFERCIAITNDGPIILGVGNLE